MRPTRSIRHAITVLMVAVGLSVLGCGRSASTGRATSKTDSDPTSQTITNTTSPRSVAETFVRSIEAGNPKSDQLTVEFKKVIAEPGLAAEREVGYSDSGTVKWLTAFSGRKFTLDPKPIFETSEAAGFRGAMTGGEATRSFSLRLLKGESGWRVDWFGPVGPAGASSPSGMPEAGFTAAAFLDAVVGRADDLASGLLSPDAKARHAPPFASDQARGYNQGILRRKLDELRGEATSYTFDKITDTTVTGSLGDRPFKLTLKKGQQPGVWWVEDWTVE